MAPGPVVPLDSLPNLSRPNLKDEIQLCLAALSRLGLEVLVVNTTHPRLNLPTVYVLVPGTHFLDRTRNTNVIFHLAKVAALYAPPLEALAALAELDAAFPHRFDVNFFLGLALENQDRAGEALEHFRRALELDPPAHELPSIYVHLGACQKDLGNYQEAAAGLHPGPGTGPQPEGGPPLAGILLLQAGGVSAGGGVLREGHRTGPGLGHRLRQPGDQFAAAGPPPRKPPTCSNRPWNWTPAWTSPPGRWLIWKDKSLGEGARGRRPLPLPQTPIPNPLQGVGRGV